MLGREGDGARRVERQGRKGRKSRRREGVAWTGGREMEKKDGRKKGVGEEMEGMEAEE